MRRILINNARCKNQIKQGGGLGRLELDDTFLVGNPESDDIIALDEALAKLAEQDNQKAELVKLRFFAGLTTD